MFKISNGKIHAFGKSIYVKDGENDLYYNDGNINYSSGSKICTIVKNGNDFTITSFLPKEIPSDDFKDKIIRGRCYLENISIATTPIYHGGIVHTHYDGFGFDFNYTNIGYIASTMSPYMFVGGPMPNPHIPVQGQSGISLTAEANRMSIMGVDQSESPSYCQVPAGPPALGLVLSFCFSWRTGKKHFYFQRGYKGIFKCGPIKADDYIEIGS